MSSADCLSEHNRVAVISLEQYGKEREKSFSPRLTSRAIKHLFVFKDPEAQIQVCSETINVLCGSIIAYEGKKRGRRGDTLVPVRGIWDLLSTLGQKFMKSYGDTRTLAHNRTLLGATTSSHALLCCSDAEELQTYLPPPMLPSGQEKGRRDHISSFTRSSKRGCGVFHV